MSDRYVRDLEESVKEFNAWFDIGFKDSLSEGFNNAHSTLLTEIECLIDEYKEKIAKIEELKEELEELKEGK
jgi:hypothetical protein